MIKFILRFLSRITVRLLLFNILLIFLPVAFFFYLDIYEKELLQDQENSMVMQGRVLSASLKNSPLLDKDANRIINNLNREVTSRIRIIDSSGLLLADSSSGNSHSIENVYRNKSYYIDTSTDKSFLYNIVRTGLNLIRYILYGPSISNNSYEFYSENSYLDGLEIQNALNGNYGATTRISPGSERSITMYIAQPIYNEDRVIAVVLLSKSTYSILQKLYEIRLEILKIFLISLLFAFMLSIILSKTIGVPLKKLRIQAKEIIDYKGRLLTHFKYSKRQDEIGDLSLSLEILTKKLKEYLNSTESFATDISHEFKNPLASIKTASDILKQNKLTVDELRFIKIIDDEVSRLNRLITDVRKISLIDNRISMDDDEEIDLSKLIKTIIDRYRMKHSSLNFSFNSELNKTIIFSSTRLTQVIDNILANAVSFAPDESTIEINTSFKSGKTTISIKNQGPNIPVENIDKIFNRFFTYRNTNNSNSGLGLSICKAIVNSYGGSIFVENLNPVGCIFRIII